MALVTELEETLRGLDRDAKIELVSHLGDIFESYNKNIGIDELVNLLMTYGVKEKDEAVQKEIFNSLLKAAIFQDIRNINLSMIILNIDRLPVDCIKVAIEVLGYSHNRNYVPILEKYATCEDEGIRVNAKIALTEIKG